MPLDELYNFAKATQAEYDKAANDAAEKYFDELSALSDEEIISLVQELATHERPEDGSRAELARALIVEHPQLAEILFRRHLEDEFKNSVNGARGAIRTINGYLGEIWVGTTDPQEESLSQVIDHIRRNHPLAHEQLPL